MNTTIASLKDVEAKGLRALTVGGFLLASLGVCAAEEAKQQQGTTEKPVKKEVVVGKLDTTTIIANRSETDLSKVGSSVSILDVKKLDRQGVRELDDALKLVPGVISDTSSGQRGTTSSLFIRGNKSDYTGFVIDGIRLPNGFGAGFHSGNFLGTGNLIGANRIEILKGPQGVLYGGSAMSGVLGIAQEKGEGDLSGNIRVEGGSFNSWNTMIGVQGSARGFSYSLSYGHETTDNDLPNNKFSADSYTLRLDYDISDNFRVGMTLRGINADSVLPDFDNTRNPRYPKKSDVDFKYNLATMFAEYDVNDIWTSKLTFGYFDEDYDVTNVSGLYPYSSDSSKESVYWENTLKWNDQHTTVAGFAYEYTKYKNLKIDEVRRKQYALYVNHVWDITEQWSVSSGLRWEEFDEDVKGGYSKDVTTWRVASAYTVEKTQTILRGSIGTGYQLPTFYQRYNKTPNNVLDSAESIGWDLGFEQPFAEGQYTVGVTYFATRIENAINYVGWSGGAVYENGDGVAETSGIESFVKANFLDDRLRATLTYTWLDRQALTSWKDYSGGFPPVEKPLFLPENVLSLRLDGDITDKFNAGMIVTYTDERALYGDVLDDYALVNIYANYKISDNLSLNAHIDNLFDKEFYYGVTPNAGGAQVRPGRGVGYFAGLTFTF